MQAWALGCKNQNFPSFENSITLLGNAKSPNFRKHEKKGKIRINCKSLQKICFKVPQLIYC